MPRSSTDSPQCIFCKRATHKEPVEHIVPESLVGEPDVAEKSAAGLVSTIKLTLTSDEVCRRCNTGTLARLDEYLQKQLGFFKALLNREGTKRGKNTTSERPGLFAKNDNGAVFIALNDENHPVTLDSGKVVQPAGGRPDGVNITQFDVIGNVARITFQQPTRMNRRFCRALHKIALEVGI